MNCTPEQVAYLEKRLQEHGYPSIADWHKAHPEHGGQLYEKKPEYRVYEMQPVTTTEQAFAMLEECVIECWGYGISRRWYADRETGDTMGPFLNPSALLDAIMLAEPLALAGRDALAAEGGS